ncbi:hypothetical protein [Neorhizobium galegae]|uniref:hypothetical protein n=1 Tax=Neorhizobium galegae TaxID=399 RepID=UPI001F44131F|nr:hypothetical protein [Neorhizobium galegae]UIK08994.1 hypothetical protein LZK81_28765 [Neorhizobium galegae]
MIFSPAIMALADKAHGAPGSSRNLLDDTCGRKGDLCLDGMTLVADPNDTLHLRIGAANPGSIAIGLPAGTMMSNLRVAMWLYPLPALILYILRQSQVSGKALSAHEDAMIASYQTAFLDCLVRGDWVARRAAYMRTQEHWQRRCMTEAGPS